MAEWGGLFIYRPYEDGEPALWKKRTVDQQLAFMAPFFGADNVVLNVGNEPVGDRDAPGGREGDIRRGADWYAELIRKAAPRGWMLSVGALPVAAYEPWEVKWWDAMLQSLAEHRALRRDGRSLAALNVHEYGHGDPTVHCAGRDVRLLLKKVKDRPAPPTWAEIQRDPNQNYLVFRTEQYLARMSEVARVPVDQLDVDIDVTEALVDRMQNIEAGFPDVCAFIDSFNGGAKAFGIPTLVNYWAWAYEKPAGEALCDINAWWETVAPRRYRSLCWFSWTTHNALPHYWRTNFAAQDQSDWHSRWPQVAATVRRPTMPDIPKPTSGAVAAKLIKIPQTYVNLRAQPNSGARDLGDLILNEVVTAYPQAAVNGWLYVKTGNGPEGWVSLQNGGAVFEYQGAQAFKIIQPCTFPVVVTSRFGQRPTPEPNDGDATELHDGVDYAPKAGTTGAYLLRAGIPGFVFLAERNHPIYGNRLVIRQQLNGNNYDVMLAHLAEIIAVPGTTVGPQDSVGVMGNTGRSFGAHLHLQLKVNGALVDPVPYVVELLPVPEPPPPPPVDERTLRIERVRAYFAQMSTDLEWLLNS